MTVEYLMHPTKNIGTLVWQQRPQRLSMRLQHGTIKQHICCLIVPCDSVIVPIVPHDFSG